MTSWIYDIPIDKSSFARFHHEHIDEANQQRRRTSCSRIEISEQNISTLIENNLQYKIMQRITNFCVEENPFSNDLETKVYKYAGKEDHLRDEGEFNV
jgi:hypothetical protein